MYEYDEECLQVFLENQSQLFDEPVAETPEVVDSIEEVAAFFREEGIDMEDMSMEELEEASEVFALPSGKYLIVEG